ncbi:Endonuclease/exonuclease/phosphatase [Radiomyces spectabilis]|uniref:Endonuclease/exonuclease/phosphatase n=1 Tax=Radiomyces spectabilis TaxID=64574 RepID=UPI0022211E49|nr:Endonuclease/exonuclease/phosphatase [Radiomyces spectabilis]KAI8379273.1 Endonuclease/exonuclease/phosphatase [Radiomyces spectabilis]
MLLAILARRASFLVMTGVKRSRPPSAEVHERTISKVHSSSSEDDTVVTTTKKPKTKKKVWEPFDPTVPRNMTMPETFSFPAKPEGSITIASYNVSSINASIKKGFNRYVDAENADILCLQETKVNSPVPSAVNEEVYKYRYWAFEEKKGYAGTAVFSKYKPDKVSYGLPGYEDKSKGRVISVTFPAFTLVACYVPNAGQNLKNLPERRIFNEYMEKHIRSLQKAGQSVIWAGDLNVAHTPIDIARPSTNERSAGFTIEERQDFSKVLAKSEEGDEPGLIDSWRHFHPDTQGHYTYYSYRFRCREKLIGWRLDYFVVTPDLLDKIVASSIRQEAWGASDHVPLVLTLKNISLST